MKQDTSTDIRPTIHPSRIAQFYGLNQCPAYLSHEYDSEVLKGSSVDEVPLSPLLEAAGNEHEQNQLEALLFARIYTVGPEENELVDRFDETWNGEFGPDMRRLHELVTDIAGDPDARPLLLHEAPIREQIEAWTVQGSVDALLAVPNARGVDLRVVEIKSSSSTMTQHKLQVATYTLLLEQLFDNTDGVRIDATVTSKEVELASVITAKGDIDLGELPTIDRRPLENDVELLLETGGPFDEVLLDGNGDLPPHQLNAACDGCPHRAQCLAHDIVNRDLALLQLPESTQAAFREHGVNTIEEVAELYEIPTNGDKRSPVNYNDLKPANPEDVEALQEATDRSDFSDLAQIAHRFLRELNPEYGNKWEDEADAGPWPTWLVGSGLNLPEDDPYDEDWSSEWDDYPKRSLVRVYPTIIHDYVRDRIVFLGAVVTSSLHEDAGNDPEFVVAQPEGLPEKTDTADREEHRLLETFLERLEQAVAEVAPDLSLIDDQYDPNEGYIHLYPWSERQRDALLEAVKRHPEAEGSAAVRKLLGFREEIDQEAVSIMTEEFRTRHALRYPGLGILQTVAQFYGGDFSWSDRWDDEYDIKEVFDEGVFRNAVPTETQFGRVLFPQFDDGYVIPDDHYTGDVYPVLKRNCDTVPLEYVWASEELDALTPEDMSDSTARDRVRNYRRYGGADSPRITLDDIEALVEAVCHGIRHVERQIHYKDTSTPKEPINVAELRSEAFEETALQRACIEYQQLDHGVRKDALEGQYRRPLQQRVVDGDAIVFECSRTPGVTEANIRGDVIDDLGRGMLNGGTAPLSISSGDWVVVTPVEEEDGHLTERPAKPEYYANSTLAVVERVDRDTISLFSVWDDGEWPRSKDPNMTWHYGWTSDESEAAAHDPFYLQEGRKYGKTLIQRHKTFVVDPAVDDYTAYRSRKALANASENVVHERLVSVYEDQNPNALQQQIVDEGDVESFLSHFDSVMPDKTNEGQASFVKSIEHSVTALQGPPGTGKTSMASSPAILARAFAHGDGFNGLCSAHSNTAVDEIVDDVSEAVRRLEAEDVLTNLSLIRVRSSSMYRDTPANVADLHYRDDEEELLKLFDEAMTGDSKVIIFGTPVTIRNALNRVVQEKSDEDSTVEEYMADGKAQIFHAALIDEASMMDLPVLFLVGAFLLEDGQLMLVGDHRQMQPIQAHDWEQETRQPIEEHTPALSVLDFVRFLRGDVGSDLSYLEREPPEWHDPDAVLPMERLTVTYRLPQPVADLETELFYSQDDISLESGLEDPPKLPVTQSDLDEPWLQAALDPDPRVTLIVHDENHARRESPFEADLTRRLLDSVPISSPNRSGRPQSVSAGVVVPFRLQRRRLQHDLGKDVQVDTVEKFQGGERDVIVLSMTAGNQGYVNTLSEFLLDPNRFNVGASRMRQKLIIIASKAMFRAGSTDATKYAEQKSWKLVHEQLVRGNEPDAQATMDGKDISWLDNRTVDVSVYTGFED